MPFALGVGDLAGAVVTVVKDGQILTERGYGYADVAIEETGRSETHAVPSRLGIEARHVDGGDAARRAGQTRSRQRHQRLYRLQGSRTQRQAGHAAQHHAAHRRFRGADQVHHHRRSERARLRRSAQTLDADARVRRRHHARVFELRDVARRLHRAARVGRIVFRLRREARLPAARHEAFHVPPAAAERPRAIHGDGLHPGIRRAEEIRNGRPRARWRAVVAGRRHVAFHDRAPAKRRVQRQPHPQGRNREDDARQPAHHLSGERRSTAFESHGTRFLRDQHQRPRSDRASGRHRLFPYVAASVAEGKRRFLRLVQQRGQAGRGASHARRAVPGIRRPLFPGAASDLARR